MAAVVGKKNSTLKKQAVKEDKLLTTGVKSIKFWHKAVDGETSIPFGSLTLPQEILDSGLSNPTSSEILSSNLRIFHNNVEVISSLNQKLMEGLTYVVNDNQIKFLNGYTATEGEVFEVNYKNDTITGNNVVDARPLTSTGVLPISDTEYNVGEAFKTNAYSSEQLGEVLVFVDGIVQLRNTNNSTATPGADGDYQELHAVDGFGTIIKFNDVFVAEKQISVISRNLIAERPDISMLQLIETMGGQLDALIAAVAADLGVPESDFQTAPNSVDLRAFGDLVITNRNNIATNTTDIGTNATNIGINSTNIGSNDVDIADLETLSGSPGATNHGSFTGNIIPDNTTTKPALQSLETAVNANDTDIVNLETLSGVGGATNNGSFTGTTIPSNVSTKPALQSLETKAESNTSYVTQLNSNTTTRMVVIQDKKGFGINGGGSTSNAWHERDLNNIPSSYLNNFCVLVAGGKRFTLTPGTYHVRGAVPSYGGQQTFAYLYQVDTGAPAGGSQNGSSAGFSGSSTNYGEVLLDFIFTTSITGTYYVRHFIRQGVATNGLGVQHSQFSGYDNIYTRLVITKINH